MQPLSLLPAVRIRGGRAVRRDHLPGTSSNDLGPVTDVVRRFADEGAETIALIDVDHMDGHGDNWTVIAEAMASVPCDVAVSGGIRSSDELHRFLDLGARRVALSSTALVQQEDWVVGALDDHADRVSVNVNVREGQLVTPHGDTLTADQVNAAVARLSAAGCQSFVVRCLTSNGRLSGPNYELLGQICARTDAEVFASGGISSLEDLRRLRGLVPIGVTGAVVGTAFAVGKFTLAEAIEVCTGEVRVAPTVAAEPRSKS